MRILVIEDDIQIAENLKEILEEHRYIVSCSSNGEEGLYCAEVDSNDLIILDWMLPDIDGIDVCREIRKKNIVIPILMLTSRSHVKDKIKGLEEGADDYLTKPFVMEELLARARALIRRKNGVSQSSQIYIGDLFIDINQCRVERKGKLMCLAPREYSLLEYMVLNKGKVINRAEILEHVWGENIDLFSNTVDVHIRYLRKKIDTGYKNKLIKTIKGKGYMICED